MTTRRPVPLLAACVVALAACLVPATAAAQTARERYEAARGREADVRARIDEIAAEGATPAARTAAQTELRRVITAYEIIARRFPTTGYADNALAQAATLSVLSFERFARQDDLIRARRYYDWLLREYPTSPLRGGARVAMQALPAPAETAVATRPTPGAPAPAPPPIAAAPVTAAVPPPAPPSVTVAPGGLTVVSATDAPPAADAAVVAQLRRITRDVLPEAVRITIELDREVPYAQERIDGPARVFFDLRGAQAQTPLKDAVLRYDSDVVRQIRVGRHPNATRVVLDLEGVTRHSVFTLYNPFRLVIDCERPSTLSAAAGVARALSLPEPTPVAAAVAAPSTPPVVTPEADGPAAKAVAANTAPPTPAPAVAATPEPPAPPVAAAAPKAAPRRRGASGGSAAETGTTADAGAPASVTLPLPPPPAPAPATGDAPAPPSANAAGGFSIARQLGLGVGRVVIDPGHGGRDPGTHGSGLTEAGLTLDVALRLEKLLQKEGLDVVLTRRTDVYVPLEERTAIANRENADLFLSIHANASRNPAARGIETYFLSFASNPEAEAVAARENSASERAMHNLPDIVKAIALNNKLDESRDLAAMVQDAMVARMKRAGRETRDLGVKKAPFVVLIGASMPSVLAEISFLTNKNEGSALKTGAHRQRIAEALQSAVLKYRRSLKGQSTTAER